MEKSVKKNFIYSSLYQILVLVLPLVTTPYVSRVFGAEKLGIYSYTNTIAQYFVIFTMLGLNNYGNRAIAIVRDDKKKLDETFSEIYTMQVFTGIVSLLCYIVYAVCIAKEYRIYSVILSIYVLSSVFDINWLFFGLEKFKLTVTRNSIIKIVSVIAILIFVKTKDDLWIYTTIYAGMSILSTIVLIPYALKEVKYIKPSLKGVCTHIKPNLIMFIPVIAVSVYKYMDKLMLGGFSKIETGYYENVEKILTVALGFVTAFGNVMLPRMSNMVAKKDDMGVKKTIALSMRFVLGMSMAMAFGLSAIASDLVPVYFGKGFDECIVIMRVFVFSIIFQSWANVIRTQYLIPYKCDNVYVGSAIAGAVLNFGVNYVLIPRMGAMGAVIGTLVAESVVAIVQTIAARKDLEILLYVRQGCPYILFSVCMYVAVKFISQLKFSKVVLLLLEILGGAFIYVLLWGIYELYMRAKKDRCHF